MLTEEEARTEYVEILKSLHDVGAEVLADEIGHVVGRGHIDDHEGLASQERLPASAALEIALRMLAAWLEPPILGDETKTLLRDFSAHEVDEVQWIHDRIDLIEPTDGSNVQPAPANQPVQELPSVDVTELTELRPLLSTSTRSWQN